MRKWRFVIGLVAAGLIFGAGALPARAVLGVPTPPTPSPGQLQTVAQSFVPPTPVIIPPSVPDPNNLHFPLVIPAAPIAPGVRPALGVLSPSAFTTCQVSYLGPLVAAVAMANVMDTLGQHPVAPGFWTPAFSPVLTVCTLAPYPTVESCGPDGTIQDTLADHPDVPSVPGGVPVVDPFAQVPAPFASLVVEIGAVQYDIEHYVYFDSTHLKLQKRVATQLECS
jgi:hypothetical protein